MRKLLVLAALALLSACAANRQALDSPAAPHPAMPQPDGTALKEGLDSRYYRAVFNGTDELLEFAEEHHGIPGEPVLRLEYKVGKGEVLTSGYSDEVGAQLTGYLRLPAAGSYQLKVTTNDGTRIYLGGDMIHDDPRVAPDRSNLSRPFEVTAPGWYSMTVWYFEKRNTSTLWILWKTPQSADFESIPPENLKHDG